VTGHVRITRTHRNAAAAGATAALVVALFLYPTSTNGGDRRRDGDGDGAGPAPVGVVSRPASSGVTDGMDMSAGEDALPTLRIVNGAPVETMYGPVQVQIHVLDGEIVSAAAIEFPQESMVDKVLNADALPALERAALRAQSAHIDTVSGATYTSDGYRGSLQAAIDAAHLGGRPPQLQ
jgi:uncharacterized protein with FMN-binding domain